MRLEGAGEGAQVVHDGEGLLAAGGKLRVPGQGLEGGAGWCWAGEHFVCFGGGGWCFGGEMARGLEVVRLSWEPLTV